MPMRLSRLLLSCAVVLLATGLAYAQPRIGPGGGGGGGGGGQQQPSTGGLIEGTNVETTARVLQALQMQVEIRGEGAQRVVVATHQQVTFAVGHMYCQQDGLCKALNFFINFGEQPSITNDYITKWNDSQMFGRLRRNANGNLIFDMDVVMFGGVTLQYIGTSAAVFLLKLKELTEFKG